MSNMIHFLMFHFQAQVTVNQELTITVSLFPLPLIPRLIGILLIRSGERNFVILYFLTTDLSLNAKKNNFEIVTFISQFV